ncbi:hypothetical protein LZF95_21945 [Algoriphagus sp. AGSA1]|uniref:hypothetical protein n=1 Tax=Algoriphagus sp. AGSA1 TaxID=2907213 RepID=UPI001F26D124|nr:hypothetical protein [Algoriphagus sp. AGSA1]MCE7057359.1 hypothetical protein [Algoriphagus sp. AGSA1]
MTPKKSQEKKKKHKVLVTTLDQAKAIFRIIFTDHTEDTFISGIFDWLYKDNDPETLTLVFSLPELLEKCEISDLLDPEFDLTEISNKHSVRKAALAASLMSMVVNCWKLFGEKLYKKPEGIWPIINNENTEIEELKEILNKITLEDFQGELAGSVLSIVGPAYYEIFLEKISILDSRDNPKESESLQDDPELREHYQMMIWFGICRSFIDAVYFYFGD